MPGPSEVVGRDLRLAARLLARAPQLALALLLMLGLGAGAGASLLALVEAGIRAPAPMVSPAGLELPVEEVPTRPMAPRAEPVEAPQRLFWGKTTMGEDLRRQSIAGVQRESLRALLWTAGGAAALTVGIVASNVALLLLSRSNARRREIAMRVVLGASRGRLAGQLLTEGLLLAVLGAVLGVLVASLAVGALLSSWPDALAPWLSSGRIGWGAALGMGVPLASLLAFSLAPALSVREGSLGRWTAGGARTTSDRWEGRRRRTFSVVAVAASFALLTSAGLLLRGFGTGPVGRDPRMHARDTLTLQVSAPASAASPRERAAWYEALLRRLSSVPGSEAESLASPGAWVGLGTTDLVHVLTGNPTRPGVVRPARYHAVSPGYFRALAVPVLRGREFTPLDREGAHAVAVVSSTFANRFFPFVDPLGKYLQLGGVGIGGTWYRIVGVVDDVRPPGLGTAAQPVPALYLPVLQVPPDAVAITVRAPDDPLGALPAVQRAIHALGPGQEIGAVMLLDEVLARFRSPLRWFGGIFAALAVLATLLAALGLHGVISYNVARRTREIGIRVALGARPRNVVVMVVRQGVGLTGAGLVLGAAGALCLGRLLQYLFLGVEIGDPVPYAAVAALLGSVALLASYLPARAAIRVEPVVALREE